MTSVSVVASPPAGGKVYAIIGQTVPPSHLNEAIEHPDALQVAYNVGVLELLSIGLTLLALFLAVMAFAGFWLIRSAAVKAADAAARDEVKRLVPLLAQDWFELEGRKIIRESAISVSAGAAAAPVVDEKLVEKALKAATEVREL